MNGYYIKAEAGGGGVSRSTAKLMKTGQTTSYYGNDDGMNEFGRNVDFFTLAENNPFGNTDRFTDELGTQTYTNNIVIDWSTYDGATVLGWSKTPTNLSVSWFNLMNTQVVTIAGFTNFILPNVNQLFSIINFGSSFVLNYPPFNFNTGIFLWSSTTQASATGNAYGLSNFGGSVTAAAKTSAFTSSRFVCRTFTVTGTTLS
jgi:hypothetical protein